MSLFPLSLVPPLAQDHLNIPFPSGYSKLEQFEFSVFLDFRNFPSRFCSDLHISFSLFAD